MIFLQSYIYIYIKKPMDLFGEDLQPLTLCVCISTGVKEYNIVDNFQIILNEIFNIVHSFQSIKNNNPL
jgi:hypothetical protein